MPNSIRAVNIVCIVQSIRTIAEWKVYSPLIGRNVITIFAYILWGLAHLIA